MVTIVMNVGILFYDYEVIKSLLFILNGSIVDTEKYGVKSCWKIVEIFYQRSSEKARRSKRG